MKRERDLALINRAGGLYWRILTEVLSTDILGNPGLQRGRDGKGETGSGKKSSPIPSEARGFREWKYRPNAVRSVLMTDVKILPYRPTKLG